MRYAPGTEEGPQSAVTSVHKQIEEINIAEELDEDELIKIGQECKRGYEAVS